MKGLKHHDWNKMPKKSGLENSGGETENNDLFIGVISPGHALV